MKPLALFVLRLGVSAVCLWLAISLMPDGMGPTLMGADPVWIAGVVALSVLGIFVMASRLRILSLPDHPSFLAAVAVTWVGQFGSTLGLGLLSADGARIARLVQSGRKLGQATRLILLDRVFGLVGLLLLALGGWVAHRLGIFAGLGCAMSGGVAFVLLLRIAGRQQAIRSLLPVADITSLRAGLALIASVLLHGLSIATFIAVARAIGFAPPVLESIVAVSIGLFFAILPISLGGWGVRELAITQGYAVIGSAFPDAVATSILYGVLTGLVALPGVVVFFWQARSEGTADGLPAAQTEPHP